MKVDCTISKDKFKNEEGKEIEFNSFKIDIGGETFSLFPRKDDKKFLNYLLAQIPEFAEE